MTSAKPHGPGVRRTPTNASMLDAWKEGRLLIQHCADCGSTFFYPRSACPSCWSENMVARADDGSGEIVSFSLVHKGLPDIFLPDAPIVLAEIRLDSGALLIARVATGRQRDVAIGDRLALVDAQSAPDFALPTFRREIER